MKKTVLLAIALLGLATSSSAQAEDRYSFYMTIQSETGIVDEREIPSGSHLDCNWQKKKAKKVGDIIPPGTLISPGGKSYAWTILAVSCKPSKLYKSGDSD